jgi:hypothetical protein
MHDLDQDQDEQDAIEEVLRDRGDPPRDDASMKSTTPVTSKTTASAIRTTPTVTVITSWECSRAEIQRRTVVLPGQGEGAPSADPGASVSPAPTDSPPPDADMPVIATLCWPDDQPSPDLGRRRPILGRRRDALGAATGHGAPWPSVNKG